MSTNYNIHKESKYIVWLVNQYGDVLVKNKLIDHNNKPIIEVCNLTITSTSNERDEVCELIKSEWGIKCKESNLEEIYSYTSNYKSISTELKVYILKTDMSVKFQFDISQNFKGSFLNYRDLFDYFNRDKKSEETIDCLVSLISYLDDIHGLSPMEVGSLIAN